ncbi:MAG TPA: pyrimidine/purine nucleosidase domain-containing protein, partial [Gammaproteobacteria bacterium]|nr:pyrimidine/purine nucleosidase domain-containing protein [Gammaproteobacteria bacterium]
MTQVEVEEFIDARVSPIGSLENLSQQEVDELMSAGGGRMFEVFRRCSLAVLTSGSELDNAKLLFEKYRDFDIRFGRQAWGVKL